MGAADNMNVSRRFREGYEPVKASEFPELKLMTDLDSRFKDNIEVGGLLLCRAPTELVESRVQGQLNETRAQMEAVDNNYLRGSDPRMPVLQPERSTRQTSFGK